MGAFFYVFRDKFSFQMHVATYFKTSRAIFLLFWPFLISKLLVVHFDISLFFLRIKIDLILLAEMNGILLPKLFWPTVTKIVLVIDKNFWNSWPSASNLQNFLLAHFSLPQYPGKIQNHTRTNFSHSRSEQLR